ncbi:MAG: YqiJ family protein [Sphingomonas sp.]|uniref:YqiJ family protein n=1 Tax=Sphingomonas sp. TaxID=28214 RepID=UPI002274D362|nr:YqiJ family protein [Sphingomonas sp.]MCX8475034.1 YqiJ family protein [Sphingomonas sp.]
MLSFLAASENVAFVTAIVLMLLIGLVQLVGLGHFAGGDVHADIHADADLLSWLGVGRLPLLMLLVVFLAIFGVAGLILQQAVSDWAGAPLDAWIAVPAVAVASLPITGFAARGLARILPRDHTTAVPLEVLIGTTAQVVTGRATLGSPARARAEDHHGQAHYVMVEPDRSGQVFEEGERVLLVRREGDLFRAISRGDFRLPSLES